MQRELPGSNPSLENNWLNALVTANGNRIFDFYIQLQQAINLNFPDTTSGTFLDRWAAIYGVSRQAATQSTGRVVATGTPGSVIGLADAYQSSDGITYDVIEAGTITAQALSASIVRTGNTATVTTDVDHGIASNVEVTLSASSDPDYNGTYEITVTGPDTFTIEVVGTETTPATTTVNFTAASVEVQSVDFETTEKTVNQPLDTQLTLSSPIAGVDNVANVDADAIGGGVAQETNESLLARLLSRIQNPVAHFSVSDIENQARTVEGVTRVFVFPVTPDLGQVTIYFMRDNDADPIPDGSEVDTVKEAIDEIVPATTSFADVFVNAPTAVPTDFDFTSITPDTGTMRDAIEATLVQFFDEQTSVGADIDEDKYRGAIISTVDTQTGDVLETFTLSTPSGDISIATGEIGTLGNVTFP